MKLVMGVDAETVSIGESHTKSVEYRLLITHIPHFSLWYSKITFEGGVWAPRNCPWLKAILGTQNINATKKTQKLIKYRSCGTTSKRE
jgi:hypothetical protein